MSDQLNHSFRNHMRAFTRTRFISAVRLSAIGPGQHPLLAGNTPFDLHQHQIGPNQLIVTLDVWQMTSNEPPLAAYWVPQGSSCWFPNNPGGVRNFVFTADFSGCSLIVDQMPDATGGGYRAYHIQGGQNYFNVEYLASPHPHGLGVAAALLWEDYGAAALPRAFAFVKYENARWWIYYQGQDGVGLNYNPATDTFAYIGNQTVRCAGRIPVADLRSEVPRAQQRIRGQDIPITRNIRAQTRMLPNDEIF